MSPTAAEKPKGLARNPDQALRLSGWRDLNPRPLRPERSALPSCATPRSSLLVAATSFTLAHRWLETKSGFAAVADGVRAGVVEGDQEDREGVEGEAEEEGVAEDVLVAVEVHVQEGVEVAAARARRDQFASGEGEQQVRQGVE